MGLLGPVGTHSARTERKTKEYGGRSPYLDDRAINVIHGTRDGTRNDQVLL